MFHISFLKMISWPTSGSQPKVWRQLLEKKKKRRRTLARDLIYVSNSTGFCQIVLEVHLCFFSQKSEYRTLNCWILIILLSEFSFLHWFNIIYVEISQFTLNIRVIMFFVWLCFSISTLPVCLPHPPTRICSFLTFSISCTTKHPTILTLVEWKQFQSMRTSTSTMSMSSLKNFSPKESSFLHDSVYSNPQLYAA